MSAVGKSVRMFLADGTPGGLITAEIMNWTGHVIAAPRSDLVKLLKREEAQRTGVYLLLGDDEGSPGRLKVYVGETENLASRLKSHVVDEEKSFWGRVAVLTSKDLNLTKAHVKYLESRVIALAKQADRATLTNTTNPDPVSLPESDRSDMEFFIDQAKIVLPVLNIDLLRATRPSASTGAEVPATVASPVFRLTIRDTDATAQEVDGEFVVREGSVAYRAWDGVASSYEKLRAQQEGDGTLVPTADDKQLVFTRDTIFRSVSAASAVVLGRSSNGRLEWKVAQTSQTYGQWQDAALADVDAASAQPTQTGGNS